MSRTLVFTFLVVLAAVATWLALPPRTRGEVRLPQMPSAPEGAPLAKRTPVGMAGCLAAACHGASAEKSLTGRLDRTTWQSSGTCWVASDPHGRAYAALTGDHAREIMAGLKSAVPATEDARCLACHTNPALAEPGPTTDPRLLEWRREGVSCEACHGNAGGWLREHTTWDGRTGGSPFGMTPLIDIGDRATACVGCHVGAPADKERGYPVRDMNHDMIAAGHPRLNFDFGEYHRRLPKHWHDSGRGQAFEARLWVVGRVAHAEAACRLLADRAERARNDDPRTPWPEFAEFNCASCHHAVPQDWRNTPERLEMRTPGSVAWQPIWPVTGSVHPPEQFEVMRPVLTTMQGKRPPGSAAVGGPARETAEQLERLRHRLADSPDDALRLAIGCFSTAEPRVPDWDTAGQFVQGLAALERARLLNLPGDGNFDRAFDAIRRRDWDATREALERLRK